MPPKKQAQEEDVQATSNDEKQAEYEENQEEIEQAAEERQEDLQDKTGEMAGGTAGGASESQQTAETQGGPGETRERGSGPELPELDPETQAGVTPLAAGPVNPGDSYDDDAAAQPMDDGSDNDNAKG